MEHLAELHGPGDGAQREPGGCGRSWRCWTRSGPWMTTETRDSCSERAELKEWSLSDSPDPGWSWYIRSASLARGENRCSRLLNSEQVTFKNIYMWTCDPLRLPSASINASFRRVLPEFRVQVNTVITAGALSSFCFPSWAATRTLLPRCGDPPLYLRVCLAGRRQTGPLIISGVSERTRQRA